MVYGPFMNLQKYTYTTSDHLIQSIAEQLGCGEIIAAILVNRGIQTAEAADRFLNPSLAYLRSPFEIKDMDKAVRRIVMALSKKERILIFGDYDVDGVTSTVLLYEFFSALDTDVRFYIPHRRKEGYGLRSSHIGSVIIPRETDLVITADCGSASHKAVEKAYRAGIDIIITDHHNMAERPKDAIAVVNPKRHDCTAGFEHLAGVGVAFCLLICLRKHLRDLDFWTHSPEPNLKRFSDIVALGTVADQVPLIKENRILTKTGIEQINTGSRIGINALLTACGLDRVETSEDIAFRLAPRLNAPGRLDHAEKAFKLLTAENPSMAEKLAENLNRLNSERQNTEKDILEEVEIFLAENHSFLKKPAWVMSDPGWHEGVLGIVAARLVEKYLRPVVLISTKDGIGKGSARSVPGFDVFEGLKSCAHTLESFGGHAAAAGLRIHPVQIDRFKETFEETVRTLGIPDASDSSDVIDYILDLNEVTPDLLDALEKLQPFGQGNPEPVFLAHNIRIKSQRSVGKNHRQMQLVQDGHRTIPAIQFNAGAVEPWNENFENVTFHLRWNRWNGNKTPQMIILRATG